jgi:hypothetical protein
MARTRKEHTERRRLLHQLEEEAMEPGAVRYETLTIPQFANRVHRHRRTVYGWIRNGQMPEGSVVVVQGHLEILWDVYAKSIRPLRVIT